MKKRHRNGEIMRGVEVRLSERSALIIFRTKSLRFRMIYRTSVCKVVGSVILLGSRFGNSRIFKIWSSEKSCRCLKITCLKFSLFHLKSSQPPAHVPILIELILQPSWRGKARLVVPRPFSRRTKSYRLCTSRKSKIIN
jgi:hypothetical protein